MTIDYEERAREIAMIMSSAPEQAERDRLYAEFNETMARWRESLPFEIVSLPVAP